MPKKASDDDDEQMRLTWPSLIHWSVLFVILTVVVLNFSVSVVIFLEIFFWVSCFLDFDIDTDTGHLNDNVYRNESQAIVQMDKQKQTIFIWMKLIFTNE